MSRRTLALQVPSFGFGYGAGRGRAGFDERRVAKTMKSSGNVLGPIEPAQGLGIAFAGEFRVAKRKAGAPQPPSRWAVRAPLRHTPLGRRKGLRSDVSARRAPAASQNPGPAARPYRPAPSFGAEQGPARLLSRPAPGANYSLWGSPEGSAQGGLWGPPEGSAQGDDKIWGKLASWWERRVGTR